MISCKLREKVDTQISFGSTSHVRNPKNASGSRASAQSDEPCGTVSGWCRTVEAAPSTRSSIAIRRLGGRSSASTWAWRSGSSWTTASRRPGRSIRRRRWPSWTRYRQAVSDPLCFYADPDTILMLIRIPFWCWSGYLVPFWCWSGYQFGADPDPTR